MRTIRTCGTLAVIVLVSRALAGGQTVEPEVRVIQEAPGVPIETRLRATDKVVIIQGRPGMVFQGAPTLHQEMDTFVGLSDAVLIMNVTQVRSALTEDKSWIRSHIEGTIVDILKTSKKGLAVGAGLDVQEDSGGELTIGHCLVKAGEVPNVHLGRNLLFLRIDPTNNAFYPFRVPLFIDNGTLVNVYLTEPGNTAHDALHGLKLEQVAADIRKLAKRR